MASGIVLSLYLRLRVTGRERMPASGPVLVIANHQSYLDAFLVGVASPRQLFQVARKSLFRRRLMSVLLHSLGGIELNLDGSGVGGLKETLRLLKQGHVVLIFAEGTRTWDGELQPLRPGFMPLWQRTGATVITLALDGAFQAYPRTAWGPLPGTVEIMLGEPLTADSVRGLSESEALAVVSQRLQRDFEEVRLRRQMRLEQGNWWRKQVVAN